jgi:hypothetical protein
VCLLVVLLHLSLILDTSRLMASSVVLFSVYIYL